MIIKFSQIFNKYSFNVACSISYTLNNFLWPVVKIFSLKFLCIETTVKIENLIAIKWLMLYRITWSDKIMKKGN